MKTLYLECAMGAAGDMLMAALWELAGDKAGFLHRMNHLFPGLHVEAEESEKCGLRGTHMRVTVHGEEEHSHDVGGHDHHAHHDHDHEHPHEHEHHHHHAHSSMTDIAALLDGLEVSERVRENAKAVYAAIAEAEAHAHGCPVEQVHFHEVGALDAVADVVGVCLLMEQLSPDRVVVSPVHVGSGQVKCAHGILPVPAPATAYLLRGVPVYGGRIRGELCTPTGAALLRHFADAFGEMPVMTLQATGCGMGAKDFEAANCVRAHLGETGARGEVAELCCNLDDMTPEAVAFACETLLEQGALDVYTLAAGMKKGRPGLVLCCVCRREDADRMAHLILLHTTTLGVRETVCRRYTLARSVETRETPYGPVRVKTARGEGICKEKPEYADIAAAARRCGVPLHAVEQAARRAKK